MDHHHESPDVLTSIFAGGDSALHFLKRIPLRKIMIWGSFLGLLYLLRDFFGVIIGTFVLSYIGNSVVQRFSKDGKKRGPIVVAYFASILLMVTGLCLWIIPSTVREAKVFNEQIQTETPYRFFYKRITRALGPRLTSYLESALDTEEMESTKKTKEGEGGPEKPPKKPPENGAEKAGDKALADAEAKSIERDKKALRMAHALQAALSDYIGVMISVTTGFIGAITKGILQIIISLIFSFMIVWDLPNITRGMNNLRHSRLGPAYREVAPSVVSFGHLLGKAFQAQTIIALVNTALTAIGLLLIGVKGIGFLSLIVFICSFIPVAGVFISTFPMALVALAQKDGGVGLMVSVVVMVAVVHAVEAYILNPQIYSAHLKLHPLLVLVVLVLAEHTVGMWGLIIAVPFTVYIHRHVIMDADKAEKVATSVDLTG